MIGGSKDHSLSCKGLVGRQLFGACISWSVGESQFVSRQGEAVLRPGGYSGSGYSILGPYHLIKSLGSTAAQLASRHCSKLITQVLHGTHLSFSPSPMSFPLLQHLLLHRLLKIDAGFLLQSREPIWLLGQYLAFILATECAIWSWGALWTGKKKFEIGSGPIDFWRIADDILGSVSCEIQAILRRQNQLCIRVARGHV